jgi:hypothetical protein
VPVENGVFATNRTDVWHHNHTDNNYAEFVICNSCLWCASCIVRKDTISLCPLCHDNKIQTIPISFDQFLELNQDRANYLSVEIGTEESNDNENTEGLEEVVL